MLDYFKAHSPLTPPVPANTRSLADVTSILAALRYMRFMLQDKKPFQEGSLQKKTVDDPFKRWQTRYFRLEVRLC